MIIKNNIFLKDENKTGLFFGFTNKIIGIFHRSNKTGDFASQVKKKFFR